MTTAAVSGKKGPLLIIFTALTKTARRLNDIPKLRNTLKGSVTFFENRRGYKSVVCNLASRLAVETLAP